MIKNFKCGICGGDCVLIHKGMRDAPERDVYECKDCRTLQGGGLTKLLLKMVL